MSEKRQKNAKIQTETVHIPFATHVIILCSFSAPITVIDARIENGKERVNS